MKYLDEQADIIDYTFILDRIRHNNIREQAKDESTANRKIAV
jgi:hypothetical protein